MIVLMDDSSVSEPFFSDSGTSMNSSISLLHHQAEFGSRLNMVSIHLFLGRQFGQMALSIWTELFVKSTHSGVLLNYVFAHPKSTKTKYGTARMSIQNFKEDSATVPTF